jgi:hypothetical protein
MKSAARFLVLRASAAFLTFSETVEFVAVLAFLLGRPSSAD